MFHRRACFTLLLALGVANTAPADEASFTVPAGFRVTQFAGDELAHDIYSLTIDAGGHVVVSGAGYVKRLLDDDGDWRADRAELFSEFPKSGAQGMYFDGPDLVFTGDRILGRIADADRDGHGDGPPQTWARLAGGEHGAHAVLLGPDGWFYVLCGNDGNVTAKLATLPGSPIKAPQAGAALRVSRDGKSSEVLAHGFRNPYDFDFTPAGRLMTVDSDGERDHHLPWYAPTRLFDVAIGRHHGWVATGYTNSWSRPQSFFDSARRVAELGRGSPTGLVVYRHYQFPREYFGGVLTADWTFGRVYFLPLTAADASATSAPRLFLQSTGESGFAPVDMAVAPDGSLFVATGGRRTRGGVYRISYDEPPGQDNARSPLRQVLAAPEALASWSRASWIPIARELGPAAFEQAIGDPSLPSEERARAVEVLTELFDGIGAETAETIETLPPQVAARAIWSLGREKETPPNQAAIARATSHDDPGVARTAWETLMTLPEIGGSADREPDWLAGLTAADPTVRAAAIATAGGAGHSSFDAWRASRQNGEQDLRLRLACLRVDVETASLAWTAEARETLLDALEETNAAGARETALEALRVAQLALGDARLDIAPQNGRVGYVARRPAAVPTADRQQLADCIINRFPSGDADVDREAARVLAMLEIDASKALGAMAATLTADSQPEDDLHYLFVLSQIAGPRGAQATKATARSVVGLHEKLRRRGEHPSRNWPVHVGEAFAALCRLDPQLPQAVVDEPDFGLIEHALFAARLPEPARRQATRRIVAQAQESADDEAIWTDELVALVAALPDDEALPLLRERWSDYGVRDAVARELAKRNRPEDFARLVEALSSLDEEVVARCAESLAGLSAAPSPPEQGVAVRALRRFCDVQVDNKRDVAKRAPYARARQALASLIAKWSGQTFAIDKNNADLAAAYEPVFAWFKMAHPDEATRQLAGFDLDLSAWKARLAGLAWDHGDAGAGRQVYEKQNCHRCHGERGRAGNDRLGPDLAGAAERFSRDDLFAAILDPNRNVAPAYQTTAVETRSGRVYHGLIVYESPDGTLLQTGPEQTIRITGDDLLRTTPSDRSLMPTGLLNDLSDRQLADLYAYLREQRTP